MSFSELYHHVAARDGANFAYHLNKLTDHFVEKSDDGYELRNAGLTIVQAIIAGGGLERTVVPPTELGVSCNRCGVGRVEISYQDEAVYLLCQECEGSMTAEEHLRGTIAKFWFGLDFFFKSVLGPALDGTDPAAANAVNERLVPKLVVVAEPLGVGVVGSGIALAHAFGYWASPSVWLWGALLIGVLTLLVGFGPLHVITTRMVVEFSSPTPDGDRLERLFGRAMTWGFVQTILMLAIVVMMTGLRGVIPI